ncbi:MAG: hypothetical protein MZV64_10380 [Ignavibacteriales bacterium]|nr:hypothetical protein [Ignavibacteriales bacterium]
MPAQVERPSDRSPGCSLQQHRLGLSSFVGFQRLALALALSSFLGFPSRLGPLALAPRQVATAADRFVVDAHCPGGHPLDHGLTGSAGKGLEVQHGQLLGVVRETAG